MNKIFFDVTGRSEWSTISGMIDRHLSMVWPQQLWINLLWKKSVIGGSTHELLVPAHHGTSSNLKQSWTKVQETTLSGIKFWMTANLKYPIQNINAILKTKCLSLIFIRNQKTLFEEFWYLFSVLTILSTSVYLTKVCFVILKFQTNVKLHMPHTP